MRPMTIEQYLNYYITSINSNASVKRNGRCFDFYLGGQKVGMACWYDRKPSKVLRFYKFSALYYATGMDARYNPARFSRG